jgi:hypothetical protein
MSNVALTPQHFDKWQRYKILAVFDLDFWFEVCGRKKLAHAELARLLEPDLADPKEWGREARAALEEAFACVEMLAFQAHDRGTN